MPDPTTPERYPNAAVMEGLMSAVMLHPTMAQNLPGTAGAGLQGCLCIPEMPGSSRRMIPWRCVPLKGLLLL